VQDLLKCLRANNFNNMSKKHIMKKACKGKGGPITPGNFPTNSQKNAAGEIINPTTEIGRAHV
jgi:hypothetical protein